MNDVIYTNKIDDDDDDETAQLRIKLENCVCGEASAPIGQMMQIILMRQKLKY